MTDLELVALAFSEVAARRRSAHNEALNKRHKQWRCVLGFDVSHADRQARAAKAQAEMVATDCSDSRAAGERGRMPERRCPHGRLLGGVPGCPECNREKQQVVTLFGKPLVVGEPVTEELVRAVRQLLRGRDSLL